MSTTKHVVILGGGFAGAAAARKLDGKPGVRVTLVSERSFMYIKFGALRAATVGGAWVDRTTVPLEKVVRGRDGRVVVGRVARVDAAGKAVILADGTRIPYDVLVCATGSRSRSMAEPPAGSASTPDALRAWLDQSRAAAASFDRIVVAGGGPVAVEFAGELRHAYPNKRITLVAGKSGVLGATSPPVPASLPAALTKVMRESGVDVVSGVSVDQPAYDAEKPFVVASGGKVRLSDGTDVPGDVVFFAVGVQLNDTGIYPAEWLDPVSKELVVDEHYVVRARAAQADVFAVGDVAKTGRQKLGYLATADAGAAAKNVLAVAAGRPPTAGFKAPGPGTKTAMVVPFGPRKGAGFFGVSLGSWLTSTIKGKDLFETMTFKALTGEGPVKAPKA